MGAKLFYSVVILARILFFFIIFDLKYLKYLNPISLHLARGAIGIAILKLIVLSEAQTL